MQSLPSLSHGPCIVDAAVETLRIARYALCKNRHKQMMLLYNEPPSCGNVAGQAAEAEVMGAVETITTANSQRIQINVIFIPEFATESRLGTAFGQSLAAANRGRYESFLP